MNPEERLLKELVKGEREASALAEAVTLPLDTVMSLLSRFESEGLVSVERESHSRFEATAEGGEYAEAGSPEYRLAMAVSDGALLEDSVRRARLSGAGAGIALQWAIRNKWVTPRKDGPATVLEKSGKPVDSVAEALRRILAGKKVSEKELQFLVSRKLAVCREEKTATAAITPAGRKAIGSHSQESSQLTPQMLKDGSWSKVEFREYDLSTITAPLSVARKHPYKEFLNRIRVELASMGFREVHGPLVELEFWNMDALFMPQDHPAREVHDVFKLKGGKGAVQDKKLVYGVKKAHEVGLAGSRGWRYEWDPEIAMQLVLRSQTTAVSARQLASGLEAPARLFCIGRVFRPDEIDWKHFIEFNQCEGIVMDDGLSFRELLGYLKTFAVNVFGVKEVKFIPHYYPFTEPSVDLAIKLPDRGWVEAGGAGMFRPEMLAALGVDKPVLAWGLGIDRFALSGINTEDIRDLFSTNVEFLRGK